MKGQMYINTEFSVHENKELVHVMRVVSDSELRDNVIVCRNARLLLSCYKHLLYLTHDCCKKHLLYLIHDCCSIF